jgi:hypothetical protein
MAGRFMVLWFAVGLDPGSFGSGGKSRDSFTGWQKIRI